MSAYDDWEKQFNRQIEATITLSDKIQVEAAKDLLALIEKRTPVGNPSLWNYPAPAGYNPGTLKASWVMEVGGTKGKVQITISNDQPYAERVENGWSTQAPSGMLKVSLKDWPGLIRKAASRNKV